MFEIVFDFFLNITMWRLTGQGNDWKYTWRLSGLDNKLSNKIGSKQSQEQIKMSMLWHLYFTGVSATFESKKNPLKNNLFSKMFYLFLLAAEHNGNYSRNLPYATKFTLDENKTETVCSWKLKPKENPVSILFTSLR